MPDRPGAAEGGGGGPAAGDDRQLRGSQGRRMGSRHRLTVWIRILRNRGNSQWQGPQPAQRELRSVHPIRRRHQPREFGGPLFNLDGEVVGINSQIYSNSGGYMGMSFAVPIDVAMEVVDQLKASGRVSRGWLGVEIQQVNRELAESFGLEQPQGALITPGFSQQSGRRGRLAGRPISSPGSTARASIAGRNCRTTLAAPPRGAKHGSTWFAKARR